ncbi:MAG TPA: acyl-CoA dehydrogenase family protein [Labilithrix sp.]|nr:acyl-CoA dehydrogenase family protein [Labilithrix sp.]
MSTTTFERVGEPNDIIERARKIAREVAAPAAADVDKNARFPKEAFDAQRKERLLGAFIPKELGGLGCGMVTLAGICEAMGSACGASGLITAMHHIQVACLVRHGADSPAIGAYLAEVAEKQRLIASVTSEVGIGGDMRSSITAIVRNGAEFSLDKDATTISYGAHADDLLVTSRRDKDAPPSDQVLTLVRGGDYKLEKTSEWDTLGMRGTCSPGFKLTARGSVDQILTLPVGDIASRTMVPISHILWSAAWLGIATDAVSRARLYVRGEARKKPGTVPPTALRVAEVMNQLQLMRNNVHDAASECERLMREADGATNELLSIGFAIKINNLKLASSQLVAQIVQQCMLIVGIQGYKNDSKFSMGRHLRDAHSAALMIGNDRIYATNASLLLVHKDD